MDSKIGKIMLKDEKQVDYKYKNKTRERFYSFIKKIKINYGCLNPECKWIGELPPCCLEFHHLHNKVKQISQMTCSSIDAICKEINKCTILCTTCHRLTTHNYLNSNNFKLCKVIKQDDHLIQYHDNKILLEIPIISVKTTTPRAIIRQKSENKSSVHVTKLVNTNIELTNKKALLNPPFLKLHWQVIAGTILGGSSLIKPKKGKHYYLSMRDKNAEWLEYKAKILSNFASLEPFTKEKTNRWHSLCFPVFDQFARLFYKEGKRHLDVESISNKLSTFGILIWYGDCGSYKDKKIIFNTRIWGKEGTEALSYYFTLCGWQTEIIENKIILDEESSYKLIRMLEPEMSGTGIEIG